MAVQAIVVAHVGQLYERFGIKASDTKADCKTTVQYKGRLQVLEYLYIPVLYSVSLLYLPVIGCINRQRGTTAITPPANSRAIIGSGGTVQVRRIAYKYGTGTA